MIYLLDTNILIRLVKRDHPEYSLVRGVVSSLREGAADLAYTLQNMTEFWNASTRPLDRNGFALTVEETEWNVKQLERSLKFLPDTDAVYRLWRRIVLQYKVQGVQVHDARLAASMYAHRVPYILTFNDSDFSRFEGIQAVHPGSVAAKLD